MLAFGRQQHFVCVVVARACVCVRALFFVCLIWELEASRYDKIDVRGCANILGPGPIGPKWAQWAQRAQCAQRAQRVVE